MSWFPDGMLDQDTVVEGYRIEELLGRGGMGTVFRARHVDSGRVVALKLISDRYGPDPDRDERFRGEGRAQAALDHPHVVTVYDAGESDHGLYLAMRLIDGPTLVDLVRERQLDARRALVLLGQVAQALDAAHAVGLVHRDVKPHNVLVGEGDHAYLADFGLTHDGARASLTATGAVVGTVAYLAPEVVRGEPATPASDRYAFAAMAFECLTGGVAFARTSDAAVLFAHANDPPPRIGARRPELGDALDDLFERALAKAPSERPATACALVGDIRRALERSGGIELPPPPLTGATALAVHDTTSEPLLPPVAPGARPGRRAPALALAALAGAGVVAAAWLAFGREGTEPVRTVSPDRPGLRYVGADLGGAPGRPLDCRGQAPQRSSPACTITQSDLPHATLVVPKTGVIRHWSVRAARGDLTLVVLRPREGGAFQVTTSNSESVGSADVQSFDTDIDVERGDLVGLRVAPGSAVGVRDGVPGATTERWLPPVAGAGRPADMGAGTGFDREVLLRVGILQGAARRLPVQVTGSAAQRLQDGRALRRRSIRQRGRTIELALVAVGGRFAVDQFAGGRRTARIQVPEMRTGAQIARFVAAPWAPDLGGLDLHFVNGESARAIQRSYAIYDGAFELIR